MRAIRSLICPCTSVIAARSLRRPGGLRDPDVETNVRATVLLELGRVGHALHERLEAVEVGRARALDREGDGPELDRHAVVEDRPGLLAERLAAALGERGLRTDEGPARPAAVRDEVAALDKRRQRLAQRRPGDAELDSPGSARAEAGSPPAGCRAGSRFRAARPSPRTSSVPDGPEHRLERGVALHRSTVAERPPAVAGPVGRPSAAKSQGAPTERGRPGALLALPVCGFERAAKPENRWRKNTIAQSARNVDGRFHPSLNC